jgi:UDP-glucose 4-epimerase
MIFGTKKEKKETTKDGEKKTVYITGIGGYVGSALAAELRDEYRIVGFGHSGHFETLRGMLKDNPFALVVGEIVDEESLMETMEGADIVIHTASPTSNKFCKENPKEATQSIVGGTRAVYTATQKHKIPLFFHFSSQAVYSNFKERPLPLKENFKLAPDTLYGSLKAEAEYELIDRSHMSPRDAQVVILRPSNIYGEATSIIRDNVIHSFVTSAKEGTSLQVNGGTQQADFVHINDVVRAVRTLIKRRTKEPVDVFNVGSGVAHSIEDIARMVAEEAGRSLGKTPEVRFEPVDKSTIAANRYLDIEKIKKFVDPFPSIKLEDGIKSLFSS